MRCPLHVTFPTRELGFLLCWVGRKVTGWPWPQEWEQTVRDLLDEPWVSDEEPASNRHAVSVRRLVSVTSDEEV